MPARCSKLFAILLLLIVCGERDAPSQETKRPPNIVLITVDDLGYADIEPFGSKINRTPHLKTMADEGLRLTSFYAAPVCSPSRSALMTGCYAKRALPIPHVLFPVSATGLDPAQPTISRLLKQAGYATGCIGKWHLGDQKGHLPLDHGFDEYLGIPYSNDMGLASEGSKSDLGKPLPMPVRLAEPQGDEFGLRGNSQPPLPLLRGSKVVGRVKVPEQQGIVETYTTAAEDFIERRKDKPFFLYLPHTAVHFPIYPGKEWAGKSPHGYYSDWVEEVDASVGRVLETIRRLGLEKETLVVFTSDNGGTNRGSNAPLRGFKASTWEGGIRVPTIAWWPGKIAAGRTSDAISGMHDLMPTAVALAGGTLPQNLTYDGRDLSPVLFGKTDHHHEMFFYFRGLTLEAVRQGDWKLHLADSSALKTKNQPGNGKPRLFNLREDIGEQNDVAGKFPERIRELTALVEAMDRDLGRDGIGPGCRPLGKADAPQPLIANDGTVRADAVGEFKVLP